MDRVREKHDKIAACKEETYEEIKKYIKDYEAGNKDVETKRRVLNAKKTALKMREKQQSEADPQRKRNRKY
jgi:hypothetical protein